MLSEKIKKKILSGEKFTCEEIELLKHDLNTYYVVEREGHESLVFFHFGKCWYLYDTARELHFTQAYALYDDMMYHELYLLRFYDTGEKFDYETGNFYTAEELKEII